MVLAPNTKKKSGNQAAANEAEEAVEADA
jgi:hypothetical protein